LVDEVQYRDTLVQTEDKAVILCSVEIQTNEAVVLLNYAVMQTDQFLLSSAHSM